MKPVEIRPWSAGDFEALLRSAPLLSERTLFFRFAAGMPTLPSTYVRSIRRRWPIEWDAVVAVADGELVGWAEYGRSPDDRALADIGLCVVDPWQHHGVGTRLARALATHARLGGVLQLHADISPANASALRLWRRVTGSSAADFALAVA